MIVFGIEKKQYDLENTPFASGGEGSIFSIVGNDKIVGKIYHDHIDTSSREKKIVAMVKTPPDSSVLNQIAWPIDALFDSKGKFKGFLMDRLQIGSDLNEIYEYGPSSKYRDVSWGNKIIIAKNLCAVLNAVHAVGHTCGDLNPRNISVNPNNGHVIFVDTDSYHINDGINLYRCVVGMPEYLPPEIQTKMKQNDLAHCKLPTFSFYTDNFALALHIFQLLFNGVHPFACRCLPSQKSIVRPEPSENIVNGSSPFFKKVPGVDIPANAPDISILPNELQLLFKRAFVDGINKPDVRPKPEEWFNALEKLEKELKQCKTNHSHEYLKTLKSCPWCEADDRFMKTVNQFSVLSQKTIAKPLTSSTTMNYSPSINVPKASSMTFNDPIQKRKSFKIVSIFAIVIFVLTLVISGMYIFFCLSKNQDMGNDIYLLIVTLILAILSYLFQITRHKVLFYICLIFFVILFICLVIALFRAITFVGA